MPTFTEYFVPEDAEDVFVVVGGGYLVLLLDDVVEYDLVLVAVVEAVIVGYDLLALFF